MSKPSWIGATLKGRYKIDSLLGQGGMSAVYRASDPNLKRVVALKLIHAHLSGDPQFVSRFETEAAAVAQLRHPNIVQVYDFDHDEDTYYMVLEFIAGESLNDRLKRITQSGRQLSVPESLHILSQVCDALDYAHKRGLVHRDIKPANIMLDVQGQAILMDFGIVKILGGETHTATGATLGTALYMSPEQVKGVVADHRADIYSLGVTLFEMLSGKPPFQADSVMTVMMMHMTDPVPNLRELRSDVPAEVVAIIEKAMAKEPQGRYQSAAEMASAMRALLARYEAGTVADQPAVAQPQPPSDQTYVEAPGAPAPDPPAPVRDEGTLVDSAPVSRPIPPPVFKSTPAPQQPAAQGDTGPLPADRPPVGQSSASQSNASRPGSYQPATVAGSPSESQPSVRRPAGAGAVKKTNALPWVLIAGGGIGALAVLAVIVILVISLINRNGGGGDQDQNLAEIATQTAVAALLLEETPEPSPTATEDPSTATLTPTVTHTATPTIPPSPTLSPTPSLTPTQTVPPGILYVRINAITIDEQNRYVVEYETFEYTEQLPGMHVHFYFDTVPHDQAGSPGRGPWELYGGPRPFTKYSVSDRPAAAEKMCALVANPNHSVQAGSGMCFDLPMNP